MSQQNEYGKPWSFAELRRALDDDLEERSNKRKAAEEEAKRKAEDLPEFKLTAMPLALKAKEHAKAAEEAVVKTEIEVLICNCRSFRYPHFLDAHKALRNEWDWRTPEEREKCNE